MERAKYIGEDAARKNLGTPPSKPAWLECQHGLPFEYLSPDEFEVFCYLLLLQENSGEEIWYYGKTGDAGRDIIRKRGDGSIELIQCKRYRDNVGFPEVKTELAKLCVNIDNKTIAERPDRVTFYVVPDLTAPAQDLIKEPSMWIEIAESALNLYLKKEPTTQLLQFAQSWCPKLHRETALSLTERAKKYPGLIDEFFSYKKVIDSATVEPKLDEIHSLVKQIIETQQIKLQPNITAQSFRTAEKIVAAIEQGKIELPTTLMPRLNYGRQGVTEFVKLLQSGESLTLSVDKNDETEYQLLGHVLPMGKTRIDFEKIFPIDGLPALEKAVQELPEPDEIEIALQYERAIESFLRWLPQVTDPPR